MGQILLNCIWRGGGGVNWSHVSSYPLFFVCFVWIWIYDYQCKKSVRQHEGIFVESFFAHRIAQVYYVLKTFWKHSQFFTGKSFSMYIPDVVEFKCMSLVWKHLTRIFCIRDSKILINFIFHLFEYEIILLMYQNRLYSRNKHWM